MGRARSPDSRSRPAGPLPGAAPSPPQPARAAGTWRALRGRDGGRRVELGDRDARAQTCPAELGRRRRRQNSNRGRPPARVSAPRLLPSAPRQLLPPCLPSFPPGSPFVFNDPDVAFTSWLKGAGRSRETPPRRRGWRSGRGRCGAPAGPGLREGAPASLTLRLPTRAPGVSSASLRPAAGSSFGSGRRCADGPTD